ncbi:hypothetical protein PsorP6_017696 [Peronosclerospora sorghi]|uniref:Uncharacterized protein n=1 Tax=Peronosclerospora sorghi TaxID=230839 RepID=A0ACC0WP62_9STRA|nr:hypothetical protein PsorP6_017696 [Peronosclerospora sorghi]
MDLNQLEQKYMQWTPAQQAIVRAQIGTLVSVNPIRLEVLSDWKALVCHPLKSGLPHQNAQFW